MNAAYRARPAAIQDCIDETSEKVKELKAKRDAGGDDPAINKALRKEQTKVNTTWLFLVVDNVCVPSSFLPFLLPTLPPSFPPSHPPSHPPSLSQLRLMQSELVVESVIRDRSMKVR